MNPYKTPTIMHQDNLRVDIGIGFWANMQLPPNIALLSSWEYGRDILTDGKIPGFKSGIVPTRVAVWKP